jgi:hypothetical protein
MSITLTTPVTFTINGIAENDTIGACSSIVSDFQNMVQTVIFNVGTVLAGSPSSLLVGPAAQANGYALKVVFNINTGVWSYTYASTSGGGVLVGATLTTLQAQFIAARNQAEGFVCVSGGLLPGTQVNWTTL